MDALALFNKWSEDRKRSGVAAVTAARYRSTMANFLKFFEGCCVRSIDTDRLAKFKTQLSGTLAPGTAKLRWDYAIALVRWASEQELLPPLRLPRSLRDMRGAPPFRRTFTRQELMLLLGAARPQMRACILLGVNVGFGNTDCANLTKRHICGSVIDQPRSKTGMPRRAFLWPETLEALNKSGLPFSNRRGGRLVTPNNDYIGSEFRALLKHVGIHGGRRGFYSLRRTFRTVVDSHWDHRAIDMIMGHATPGMGTRYVAWIDDDRLESVAMHAKQWMHGPVRTECRPDRDADSQQRRAAGHPQSSV